MFSFFFSQELRDHKHNNFLLSAARMSAVESKGSMVAVKTSKKKLFVTSLSLPKGHCFQIPRTFRHLKQVP